MNSEIHADYCLVK